MSKIYIVSPFYPYRGGIAQFSDALASSLKTTNDIQKINYKRLYPAFLFPGKSQFIEDHNKSKVMVKDGIDSINPFSTLKLISKINKEHQKTAILSVYWMSFFSPVLSFINKFSSNKIKNIALIHNLIPHEPRFFDSFFTRLYLNQQEAFVVLSEKVKNDLLKFKPNAKVLQLFHPLYNHFGEKIDKQIARAKYAISSEKKVLLFFGLIRDYKGLDVLLNALNELDDSYLLIIAGECYGGFDKYQSIIDANNLETKIKHLDSFVSDDEVKYLFSAADICVLPYRNGTQSGVTATAIHFDLPIVSTNVGGLSEYVNDGFTGLLVEPENHHELTIAIKKATDYIDNENFLSEINSFKKKLSWELFSSELNNFIHSLQ
jgi:glycosyltransferase involved in cell wall biosynthesis